MGPSPEIDGAITDPVVSPGEGGWMVLFGDGAASVAVLHPATTVSVITASTARFDLDRPEPACLVKSPRGDMFS